MWTSAGAVLIDPAAHGGHPADRPCDARTVRVPYLAWVLAGYAEVGTLPDGWQDLIALHQVYPVGMHAVLFGGGYGDQLAGLLHRYV